MSSFIEIKDIVPTICCSLTVAPFSEKVSKEWDVLIQGKPKAIFTINDAQGNFYGSAIKNCSIKSGEITWSISSFTPDYLVKSGKTTFIETVTDSKVRTSKSYTVTINVFSYQSSTLVGVGLISSNLSDEETYLWANAALLISSI